MGLRSWWKRVTAAEPEPAFTLKPDCVASATCVAMAALKAGYETRIICKKHHPGMNHAQAQVKINDKWVWVRMQNHPFDIGVEEFPEKPNIQWWELRKWIDNFFKHEKKRVR